VKVFYQVNRDYITLSPEETGFSRMIAARCRECDAPSDYDGTTVVSDSEDIKELVEFFPEIMECDEGAIMLDPHDFINLLQYDCEIDSGDLRSHSDFATPYRNNIDDFNPVV